MKKTFHQLVIDSLTKTWGQIYDESSKGERLAYWISLVIVCAIIVAMSVLTQARYKTDRWIFFAVRSGAISDVQRQKSLRPIEDLEEVLGRFVQRPFRTARFDLERDETEVSAEVRFRKNLKVDPF